MDLKQIVNTLPIESAHLISEFSFCGDYQVRWKNDAANLPDFEIVAHLFTEPGGGPRTLPGHWNPNNLGAFGQAMQRQNNIINRRLETAGLLREKPRQRMTEDNRRKFGRLVTERMIREGYLQ